MRKLPNSLDDPVDNVMLFFCEKTAPFFHVLHFTPNGLTTCSLIFSLLSAILFFYNYYFLSALCWMIGYFFDSIDGFYARKYHMVSKFGDLYDHMKDFVALVILVCVFFYKWIFEKNKLGLAIIAGIIFILLIFLSMVRCGCTEKYYEKSKGSYQSVLTPFSSLCNEHPEKILKNTKLFGIGMISLYIAIIIFITKYL